MSEVLKQLPKTELHCHLDGSLSLKAIRQLGKMAGVSFPNSDEALKELVTAPKDCVDLVDYLKTFDVIRPLLQTKEALAYAAYDVARQAAEENVIYTEIRFAPELSMDQGLTVTETIEAVCDGLRRARQEFGIVAKALVCGMRQTQPEMTMHLLNEANQSTDSEFVGFDVAGDEHNFPPEQIRTVLEQMLELQLPMTFHAGECGCVANVAYSIALGIKRTGHTTAIANHPEVIAEFVKNGVTAELCLSSNLHTKIVKDLSDFPYLDLVNAGAKVTINCDNRTVSDTNLTKEYGLYMTHFGTTIRDFLEHNQVAVSASFASQDEKAALQAKLLKGYEPFLSKM